MSVCRWCGRERCREHDDLERLRGLWLAGRRPDAVRAPHLTTPPEAVRLPAACTDESIAVRP